MASGLSMARQAAGGFNPSAVSGMRFYTVTDDAPIFNNRSGTGTTFTLGGGNTIILTDTGQFNADDRDCEVEITGATSPGNNSSPTNDFKIRSVSGVNTISWDNLARVAEAFPGTWNIRGRATSITDRFQSLAFTQATTTARAPINVHQKPGHNVFSFGHAATTVRKFYACATGVAADFNGVVQFTLFSYANILASSASGCDMVALTNDTTLFTQALRFGVTTTALRLITRGSAGIVTHSLAHVPTPGFFLYSVTYDGAGVASFYRNGVLLGTDSGAVNTISGLTSATIGMATTSTEELYSGGVGAAIGQISPSVQTAFAAWYDQTFAP